MCQWKVLSCCNPGKHSVTKGGVSQTCLDPAHGVELALDDVNGEVVAGCVQHETSEGLSRDRHQRSKNSGRGSDVRRLESLKLRWGLPRCKCWIHRSTRFGRRLSGL